MSPDLSLTDLDRERIRRARAMPPEEKLMAGARLFDEVCERMRSGIRHQFPGFTEDEVESELRRRLELARRLEQIDDE